MPIDGFAQEEAMTPKIRCAHCRRLVVPNPRLKTQRFCAKPDCQRARRAQWQRDKMATDADYQANQKDYQRAWQARHPDYWRQYRQHRPDYRERNRLLQKHRDQKRRLDVLAKMDVSTPLTFIKPGVYHLIPEVGEHLAKMDVLSMKCHLIPMV